MKLESTQFKPQMHALLQTIKRRKYVGAELCTICAMKNLVLWVDVHSFIICWKLQRSMKKAKKESEHGCRILRKSSMI